MAINFLIVLKCTLHKKSNKSLKGFDDRSQDCFVNYTCTLNWLWTGIKHSGAKICWEHDLNKLLVYWTSFDFIYWLQHHHNHSKILYVKICDTFRIYLFKNFINNLAEKSAGWNVLLAERSSGGNIRSAEMSPNTEPPKLWTVLIQPLHRKNQSVLL